jgi:hypothetical protein
MRSRGSRGKAALLRRLSRRLSPRDRRMIDHDANGKRPDACEQKLSDKAPRIESQCSVCSVALAYVKRAIGRYAPFVGKF